MIPTAFDKTLSPEGTHIMSLFTQWVPADWSEEPHTEELEAYADRMIDCYNELAPNFKSSILHRDVVGPYEMEHEYGLIGGNIFHGELSLEQLFHMRPAPGFADYRTPVDGLYYGSSATHAGGGVCGIPGWQAAKAAIADRKSAVRGRSGRSQPAVMTALSDAARARITHGNELALPAAGRSSARRPAGRSGPCSRRAASRWSAPRPGRPASAAGCSRRSARARRGRGCTRLTRRYAELDGRRCYPSLAELPEAPELALLAVPDAALEQQLALAAEVGSRAAVIFGNAHEAAPRAGHSAGPRA